MFERFTTDARDVVVRAQQVARATGARVIDTGHLLVGVAGCGDPVAAPLLATHGLDASTLTRWVTERGDAELLRTLGIDVDHVRRRIEGVFGRGALGQRPGRRRGHLPLTAGAKGALELSLRESLRLGHRHIGPEHILLGLLREDGDAAGRLTQSGITRSVVEDGFGPASGVA